MFEWYTELQATSSSKEKVEILKRHDSPRLRKILLAAYDPLISYGIKLSTDEITANPLEPNPITEQEIFDVIDALKNRELTGNSAARVTTNVRCRMKSDISIRVFEGIINRDLRCGISDSTINKAFPGLIPTFDLMACHTLDEKTESRLKFPAVVQLKYDAARVAVIVENGTVKYFTRNGKDYGIINPKMDSEFLTMSQGQDYVFDGEIWQISADGGIASRTVSNGVATKFIRGTASLQEHENIGITLWDVVPLSAFKFGLDNVAYKNRWRLLTETMYRRLSKFTFPAFVNIAESKEVNSVTEAMAIAKQYMTLGLEGAIVKNLDAPWEAKRSFNCLKIKAIREADLVVIGVEEGTGKNVGKLGNLICASKGHDLKVGIGTGFSDLQRDDFWKAKDDLIGKVVTVQYNELISSKGRDELSLFLPRFIELRFDKTEADTLDKIKAGT